MRQILLGSQMREVDRHTIEEVGIPSMVLMERAAFGVVEVMVPRLKRTDVIWVVCGLGNNGADGVAIARMLSLKSFQVMVLLVGEESRAGRECAAQLSIARHLLIPVMEMEDFIPGRCDVVVDAIFGVGLARPVEGVFGDAVRKLKGQEKRLTVAVDIPTGIHSDTGQVMGEAIKADLTVTFGYEKMGTVLYPGREYAGSVTVCDIGFPPCSLERIGNPAVALAPEDLAFLPGRPAYSNKGSYGKVLVVAGSEGMAGAAYLSALAAYRCGAGLVKVMTPRANLLALQNLLPEAILAPYEPEQAADCGADFQEFLEDALGWASVVVLGPGLGSGEHVLPLVEGILSNAYVPVILDADGLNTVATHPYLTQYFTENIIITPHLGEMARLTGTEIETIQNDLTGTALNYSSAHSAVCVLKDAVTVVAGKDGQLTVNTSGNSAMAKAGAGDVLSGAIAGLAALGMEEYQAAAMGVYLHGLAGDRLRAEKGAHGLLAGELADELAAVMGEREDGEI